MAMKTVKESGMEFGPFDDNFLYEIEHSDLHKSVGEGIKIAEFIFYEDRSECFWIIEAKSSSPRPASSEDFSRFIREIEEKLTNALFLLNSALLERHRRPDIPTTFVSVGLNMANYKFILVIREHAKGWLPPLQDAMNRALSRYVKTWNISPMSMLVLNDDMAKSRNMII